MANSKLPDEGHIRTDKELVKLEKRIAKVYKQAADDMQGKVTAYFESFAKRDEETKALIGTIVNGKEYTESDYKQWRLAQMGRGERYKDLQSKLAERYTKANQTAIAYVNDATPGIYSLNRNYSAYTIEKVTGDVGFTMWDESTVKRLIKEQPDLMPSYPKKKAVNRGIDLAYGKKQITSQVTSGILQGESIKQLSDRLQTNIPTMQRDSAIRAARTAVTGAQNAGRQDSYEAAKGMGIKLKKEWLATLDKRTRHEHAALDGQQVDTDLPFEIDGYELMYPGDPDGAPEMIYNCRCSMIAAVEGVDTSSAQRWSRNLKTGEKEIIPDMTYSEWAGWKQNEKDTAPIESRALTIQQVANNESLNASRRVYGKVDGQKYESVDGDEVTIYQQGRQRGKDGTYGPLTTEPVAQYQVPENKNPDLLVATGLPDKAAPGMIDNTPNYILSDGRVALNRNAKNNNTREQIHALVENEVDVLSGIRKDGHYYRVISSDKEIDYIKKGTIRKSVNHMTGKEEDGLSVWEYPKYSGGKIVEITGDVISTGSDGEPILDISTLKFVRVADDIQELRESGKSLFKEIYNWTDEQIKQAYEGGYKLNR